MSFVRAWSQMSLTRRLATRACALQSIIARRRIIQLLTGSRSTPRAVNNEKIGRWQALSTGEG